MSGKLNLDAMERRTFEVRCDTQTLISELRRLREENARLEELLNRAARIASELTGFPWPLPKPPEVG